MAVQRSASGRTAVLVGLVAAITVGVLATVLVATGSALAGSLDDWLTETTRRWADAAGWPVAVADLIGTLTAPGWAAAVAAVVAVGLLLRGLPAAAALLAISAMLGGAATTGMKYLADRPRPGPALQYGLHPETSFPSGHASAGIYLILAVGLVLLRVGTAESTPSMSIVGRVLIAFGPLVGVSRLVLGVHWPTDIIAGWAFGSAALCIASLLLWDRLAVGWTGSDSASR